MFPPTFGIVKRRASAHNKGAKQAKEALPMEFLKGMGIGLGVGVAIGIMLPVGRKKVAARAKKLIDQVLG